jgi:peptidoglycan/LPS O-acetylase OafA/YrhL
LKTIHTENTGHKNNFDFVRFLLAVSVIFTHGYVVYTGVIDSEPFWRLSRHQLGLGTISLNFFFVISGYLVLQSWTYSKGMFDFLKKRVLRIYPGFITVCILCAFIFGPLGNGTLHHPFSDFISYWKQINLHVFVYDVLQLFPPALPDSFVNSPCPNDINTSIWTIWYEFVCYLVILVAGLMMFFKKQIIPLVLFLLILGLNIYHFRIYRLYNEEGIVTFIFPSLSDGANDRIINMEHFLLFFLSGSCFYFYRKYIPKNTLLIILSSIILIVSFRWVRVFELCQAVFGTYLLLCFVFSDTVKLNDFAKRGDFSYGIYLYGWPIQQLVFLYFGSRLNIGATIIVSLILVFPFAFFSWFAIEKPCLSLKKKTLLRLKKVEI